MENQITVSYKGEAISLEEKSGCWKWQDAHGRASYGDNDLMKVKARIDTIKRKKANFKPIEVFLAEDYDRKFEKVTITSVIDGVAWMKDSEGNKAKSSYSDNFFFITDESERITTVIMSHQKEIDRLQKEIASMRKELPKINLRDLLPKEESEKMLAV